MTNWFVTLFSLNFREQLLLHVLVARAAAHVAVARHFLAAATTTAAAATASAAASLAATLARRLGFARAHVRARGVGVLREDEAAAAHDERERQAQNHFALHSLTLL